MAFFFSRLMLIITIAVIYCLSFWIIAIRHPFLALVAIFAIAPATNTLPFGGLNLAIADVNAILTIPALIMAVRRSRFGFSLGPMGKPIYLYLGMCALSSLISFQGKDAIISMIQMLLYMMLLVPIFATLCAPEQLWRIFYYVVPVGAVWSLIGLYTKFDFMHANKNGFGASLAATFLVTYDLWLSRDKRSNRNKLKTALFLISMLIILAGLLLSVSRGAWIGTLVGVIWITLLRRSYKQLFKHICAVLPLLVVLWFSMPSYMRSYALSMDNSRWNIQARYASIDLAKSYFLKSPLLGDGVGLRKQYDATSLFWSTLAESGLIGAFFFLMIFYVFFRLAWRSRFVLSPSDPRFSLLTIGSALVACKCMHGLVDNYWTRGTLTMAWAGFGLVLSYYRMSIMTRSQIIEQHWQRFRHRPRQSNAFRPVTAFRIPTRLTNSPTSTSDSLPPL